jgi:hypothetical protein
MKEKRRAYIGQGVYTGRPGRLPDVECCHLVFVWLYIIPTVSPSNKTGVNTQSNLVSLITSRES